MIDIALNQKEEKVKDLENINSWLLDQAAPKNFDGEDPKNILVIQESTFGETCTLLEELGIVSPEQLTAFKFYTKIRYYKKKHQKNDEPESAPHKIRKV